LRLGNGKFENTQYNSRLQPTQIGLGASASTQNLLKLNYDYGTTQNNGNVLSQQITVPTVGSNPGFIATQTYTYDSLNRIKDAKEMIGTTQTWMQTFLYDRYGNRNFDTTLNRTTTIPSGCSTAICNPGVNTANNRLSTTDGYVFDNAGNTTKDAQLRKFTYDGENKQVKVETTNSGGTVIATNGEYVYDGDGKRIKKKGYTNNVLTEETIFVYDAAGRLVAEYSTNVAPASTAKVAYLTNDHLGSPRINTDANGAVISKHDYHPFGEEVFTTQRTSGLGYAADTVRKKFTGYQRDDETELDYAGLRIYSSKLGRFFSADPIAPDIYTPLTLNRYEYCLNNPLRFVDAGGGYEEDVHRDLTAALAYVVGFSEGQGNIIGGANQWLDDPKSGHTPMPATNGPGDITGYYGRRDYHFTTEERRNELWQSFETEVGAGGNPLAALGTYMHPQQDSFSHADFGPNLGQVYAVGDNFEITQPIESIRNRMKEMEKYDKTNFDPGKAVTMARDTLAKLLAARNLMERSGKFGTFRKPIPWETDKFINDKLGQWARTTGATTEEERNNKRKVLLEIMNYATNCYSPNESSGRSKRKRTKTTVKVVEEK
jgi:RHS repeat-associated protein